ncbi:hypothetical protein [Lentzea sp. HUAS12]|uniref:hypothetical protein n=1 Tax=Lentzea sp. HUAS12 TaxID=2951806 RepID=UPI0020A0EA35|nr:hypothetical protein [Lentzea sp. HUAS12]USX54100.1 hypothetical protein ND450_08365 [Lentzea sp. HUAS12]
MLQEQRASDSALKIRFETWGATDIKIRVSPPHADELIKLLKENGADASLGAEFSAGQTLEIVHAIVENEAFWPALAATVAAFLARHSTRKTQFKVGDEEINFEGHSPREEEKLIEKFRQQHVERELKAKKPEPP